MEMLEIMETATILEIMEITTILSMMMVQKSVLHHLVAVPKIISVHRLMDSWVTAMKMDL